MVHFIQTGFLADPVQTCARYAAGITTPLLFVGSSDEEIDAFAAACGEMQFIRPAKGGTVDGIECSSKKAHLAHLLCAGRNIAIKGSLLNYCDDAMLKAVRYNGYTLISPEDAIMWEDNIRKYNAANMQEAIRRKQLLAIAQDTWLLSPAHSEAYVLRMLGIPAYSCNGRLLIKLSSKGQSAMYWGLQPLLFENFADAYIFHPMPRASQLAAYLKIFGARYDSEALGPSRNEDFSSLLRIVEDSKYNQKGDDASAYTSRWYASKDVNLADIFKDMLNVLLHAGPGGERRELIAYTMPDNVLEHLDESLVRSVFRGRGFPVAQQYIDKDCSTARILCYCANPFLPAACIHYLRQNGSNLTQDDYALYRLLRWISRSAVHNGEPVTVYVPSKRMRGLLERWKEEQGVSG